MKRLLKLRKSTLFFLPILGAVIGCASASVSYYRDPESLGKTYKRVAILYPIQNVGVRIQIENQVKQYMRKKGVDALTAAEVYSPTKTLDPQEFIFSMKKYGIEGLIFIKDSQTAEQLHTYLVPNTNTVNVRTTDTYGNSYYSTGTYTTYNTSSYSTYATTSNVEVYDLETFKRVWVGTVDGTGLSPDQVATKMISVTTDEMIKSRLLSASLK